ncbi:HlyD family type I secretion periplasmic adaptor subunit [Ferribacterium limneticum]|uniref:HlyD family type I secretion periplasmic adaptor subunit n=1 Tax=Ferribacterium limneticum TaxID=76259 RepID=UPI001CFA8AEA|nr:HlyD family type I secretion periplasmic adaptor subunit [Ferribacterium limneticum]UCV29448.1 HlyD family type I secretion periplasmic adaptor subunit [Ferribacterium limneticum]UCV33367.1 HlyD family type I secretion periplasmic adaptor subunit [Ferribacterium limneticum]
MSRAKALLGATHAWLEHVAQRGAPYVEKVLGRLPNREEIEVVDFATDADLAMLRQEPLRARVLLRAISVVFIAFVLWAAIAQLDEVTRGEGRVIPSRQVQILQSIDGGLVSEILVKEGEVVQPNQLLIKIDETRFVSSVKENQAQYLGLVAKASRLRAISEGKPFVPPPEVLKADASIVQQERQFYEARNDELNAAVSIARQQLAQRQQELNEAQAKRAQASQGYDLTSRELAVTKPLINSGAVSEVELLRLERDVSRYRGERDMAAAQISRVQASINEAQRKIEEVELTFRNDASKELSETMAKLNSLAEGSVALSDRVKQSSIRSPVKGTVKRLLVNTVGGVIQPGKDMIEIVPLEDTLLLEARVLPRDIAFLRPGQPAMVKFTAYDFSIYGGLEGTLEHIGADTVMDDKGNAFYTVRVRTNKPGFGDANLPIIPGMVAEVDILTGKKSVLAYLVKPVLRAKSVALTER